MEEEKKTNSQNNEKLTDILHNKSKLQALRTYQGDVAEFIQQKDQSIASIVVKEKEKKEKQEYFSKEHIFDGKLSQNVSQDNTPRVSQNQHQDQIPKNLYPEKKIEKTENKEVHINILILSLGIILVLGGIVAGTYAFRATKTEIKPEVITQKIIPFNSEIAIANVSKESISSQIAAASSAKGVTYFKISDTDGVVIDSGSKFFDFLKVELPGTLGRSLKSDFFVGSLNTTGQEYYFLIVSTDDFGRSFAGILEWEKTMAEDLNFMLSTSTYSGFSWKDMIVRNKDTRIFSLNSSESTILAYTFLDKNTILIANSIPAIIEISSIYASRAVVR